MNKHKKTLIASAVAGALPFVAALASLAFRPALLLGIEGDALAHSVDSKLPSIGATCGTSEQSLCACSGLRLCRRQWAIRQRRGRDMQGSALATLVGEIEGNSLLQRFKKLVKRVAGGKAAGQLWNVRPVAAVLNMDTRG
jgi:hypothetical protein